MNYFKGFYFKHQKDGQTIAFIPGVSKDGAFIQVICPEGSFFFSFPDASFRKRIKIGKNLFAKNGIKISLPGITGTIRYEGLTLLRNNIMGIFRFFPMECRHRIISMRHLLHGKLTIFGKIYDLSGGTGYIEGDSGCSFPSRYIWIQANDFTDQSSITLSLARIPFLGLSFAGAFAVLFINGKEHRFATYYGCSVTETKNRIIFRQGRDRLVVRIQSPGSGHPLAAPGNEKMNRVIKENNNAVVSFHLYRKQRLIYHSVSFHAGYEKYPYID